MYGGTTATRANRERAWGVARSLRCGTVSNALYCWAKMYAGHVACCPLASHGQYVRQTDGRTPDRYVTLSMKRGQRNKTRFLSLFICCIENRYQYFLKSHGLIVFLVALIY